MKIATIEKILEVNVHPNADKLSLAKVNGWQVCIKKDEYKQGDFCVYVTVDSIVNDCAQYEFLRNKHFRIKTMKLRGAISQGIIFPLSIITEFGNDLNSIWNGSDVGIEVSNLIGINHYEKPISPQLAGHAKGHRPSWIRKTDEDNIKSNPGILAELHNKPYYITCKVDGCIDESTVINTEDGNKTIKEICDTKYIGKILSYDVAENKIKYSKVINHFIHDSPGDWYEIETESGKKLKITGNHMVWLPEFNCYRSVDKLSENDVFLINM
jgi:RNA ligase (TIGR02306 family)